MNKSEEEIPEVFPEGVELHDFTDLDHWRNDIYGKVKRALESNFPKSYGGVQLSINDLEYVGPERLTPREEREKLLHKEKGVRRLRGTVTLTDEESGEVLDSVKKTLMGVPYLTGRGTFIHNGSNYVSLRQSRLRPGVYTRRKENNNVEAHYNINPGTGKPFRVELEADTGLFRLRLGGSNLKLYSLLKDLGVEDSTLRETWGDSLFKKNRDRYDARDINKVFTKLYPYEDTDIPREQKISMIKEKLFLGEVEREIINRTLGTHGE